PWTSTTLARAVGERRSQASRGMPSGLGKRSGSGARPQSAGLAWSSLRGGRTTWLEPYRPAPTARASVPSSPPPSASRPCRRRLAPRRWRGTSSESRPSRRSEPDRRAIASGVGAGDQHAALLVDPDRLRRSHAQVQRRRDGHSVAARPQFLGDALDVRNARLQHDGVWRVVLGRAAVDPARRLDRELWVEAVVDHVGQHLELRLRLPIRAAGAKDERRLAILERQRRDEGVKRPLAGGKDVRMLGVEAERG